MRDYQHEIAKMSNHQGQVKRKRLTLDFLCQDKRKQKETTASEGMYTLLKNVRENKY